ncbi:MAG: hypothetical protein JWM98_3338 [Thermoleophilia bacterium]|nr:hypothetical protein [Thermoleophilia bacterium]
MDIATTNAAGSRAAMTTPGPAGPPAFGITDGPDMRTAPVPMGPRPGTRAVGGPMQDILAAIEGLRQMMQAFLMGGATYPVPTGPSAPTPILDPWGLMGHPWDPYGPFDGTFPALPEACSMPQMGDPPPTTQTLQDLQRDLARSGRPQQH